MHLLSLVPNGTLCCFELHLRGRHERGHLLGVYVLVSWSCCTLQSLLFFIYNLFQDIPSSSMVSDCPSSKRTISDLRLCEDQVNFFKRLSGCFWTQEPDERNRYRAGEQHPQPDFPAHVLQGNTTSENSDEAKEPLTKGSSSSSKMTKFERSDLERRCMVSRRARKSC